MVYVRVLCGPPLGTEHRPLSIRLREDVLKQKLLRCGKPCADFNLNSAHEATVFALQAVVMRDGEHPAAASSQRQASGGLHACGSPAGSVQAAQHFRHMRFCFAFDHGGGDGSGSG
jgi:hypothetical protein